MVLQQQCDARFWGTASPGCKVEIRPSWGSQTFTAMSDSTGKWQVSVPTPKAGGPYTIELSDGESTTLRDVLIGEVWICSGQSNMEMPMRGFLSQPVAGAIDVIAGARPSTPIRICTVKRATARDRQDGCTARWQQHTAEAVSEASATAYYFARCLQSALDVPVGIIVTCWSGTPIEAWMDRAALSEFSEFDLSFLDRTDRISSPQNRPCMLYNAMLAPLVPYTIKGFVWYQGEANRLNPSQYQRLLPAFVRMLRAHWGQDLLPFYYVQIAPYRYENADLAGGSALLRESQFRALSEISASGMAVTLDIGDRNFIHPAQKSEVGKRLAWLALSKSYGVGGFEAEAPLYESMTVEGDRAYLTFRTGQSSLAPLGRWLTGFEVAGANRIFYPAKAWIDRDKQCVVVTSSSVTAPVAVRYGFRNYVDASLFNSFGIPASSFRTDDWELPVK